MAYSIRIIKLLTSSSLLVSTLLFSAPQVNTMVLGVDNKQAKNILAQLSIAQDVQPLQYTKPQIEQLHRRAENEIKTALQPFGYYHATIQSTLDLQSQPWKATYRITLGRPTLVDDLKLQIKGEGRSDLNLYSLFQHFPLRSGDILDHDRYEDSKKTALLNTINQGYVHAFFDRHEIIVDLSTFTADIDLSLTTGKLYHLGPVSFDSDYFAPTFLARFVPYELGDVYHPEKILELENNLSQSHYFSHVEVEPLIPQNLNDPAIIPVNVIVKKPKANQYLLGIGYDTDTGARLRLGWERRYINQYGHRFVADTKISQEDITVSADYIIPGKKPVTDEYRLYARYIDDKYQDRPSKRYIYGISDTTQLAIWRRTLELRYLSERFKDSNSLSEHVNFLLPSITMLKITSDHPIEPTRGYRLQFTLHGGIDTESIQNSFAQGTIEYKWLRQIQASNKLIFRTELGATFPNNIEDIPLSVRFFAGGDNSIRGFEYRSLPSQFDRNGNLRPLGGAYLAISSLEFEQKVKGPFSLATFIDAGNAFNEVEDDIQVGVGVGFRWATPIGPLKVDVGKPLTPAAHNFRLHVNFGPELR